MERRRIRELQSYNSKSTFANVRNLAIEWLTNLMSSTASTLAKLPPPPDNIQLIVLCDRLPQEHPIWPLASSKHKDRSQPGLAVGVF